MANNLTDARRSLTRAKEAAIKRLAELDAERHEVKASIKSLNAALKVLSRSAGKAVGDSQTGSRGEADDAGNRPA